ncbi:3-dehydroquinate synthase [Candidatus Poribacteria bacterium]|nr:3-dehydroquinate synthase [Candidatus Poribacteria bacterium]MBT5709816.1 3-dehydroquinate synthase [Candidatus Poribacteria bacterium]MBT7098931.1 3-dehydroquinate synthase [Candidatus Poribacteria bacterium]MBT7806569.1 3-dehydroquinate synthase [Candidatus Poribacteria bacterium]
MKYRVRLDLGERSYDVAIGADVRARLAAELAALGGPAQVAVVTSPELRELYADEVAARLRDAGHDAWVAEMRDGEAQKTLATASGLYDQFIAQRMERSSIVVALGGGVVGDVAGFVAATYMRGVRLVQMPTTLISQVDSSVGGKTAVDHPMGKNLIGAFHQPKLVLIDIATLKTLPARQLRAGLAEVLRYAVIQSPSLFSLLQDRMPGILARDEDVLSEIVHHSVSIKARIVEQDETEGGLRGTLNYGHTFGHAVEAVAGYSRFLHGEAVAIGMACAAEMSAARGMVDREFCDKQRAILSTAGLPTSCPDDIDVAAVVEAMKLDKKVKGGRVRFIVPTAIGSVEIRDDFSDEEAAAAIEATAA